MVRLVVMLAAPVRATRQIMHALRFLTVTTSLEPGCLGCRVTTGGPDDSVVRYEEEWATEDAMRTRLCSEQFTRVLEIMESVPEPPFVQFDFVTRTRGLDYVEEVRARRKEIE